jgi:hypothetical protein
MSGLPLPVHLSAQTWFAIGAIAVLVLLLLAVRVSRARNAVVPLATADMIAFQLSRIADALDRGALERIARPEPLRRNEAPAEPVRAAEARPTAVSTAAAAPGLQVREPRGVGLSMFGR